MTLLIHLARFAFSGDVARPSDPGLTVGPIALMAAGLGGLIVTLLRQG